MPRPSIEWIITDLHLYHNKIIEACSRPDNYMELVSRNLRKYLAPQDILYDLGDVIFYQHPKLKDFLATVPGKKILIMGNHDKKSKSWYMKNGYDFAAEAIQLDDILLSHKPANPLPDTVKYNIHGHWHNVVRPKPDFYDDRYRLLSLEHADYKPVQLRKFVADGISHSK